MSEIQSSEIPELQLVPEDQVLAFTQFKRQQIANQLLADGKLPEDPKMAKLALDVLDGMDRAALGRKRIKVEEKANQNQEQAAALIAEVLNKVGSYRAPALPQGTIIDVPKLGNDVPEPELVPGETSDIGSQSETYETFTARMFQQPND